MAELAGDGSSRHRRRRGSTSQRRASSPQPSGPGSTTSSRRTNPTLRSGTRLSVDDVLARLATGLTGLASAEAAQRLHVYGPNELQALTRVSAWHTFAAQFQNVLILILLGATLVSGFLGHTLEAVVITVIVLFAVLLGFIQEHRAGRALEALEKDGGARRTRASRRRRNGRADAGPGAGRCGACCARATACPRTRA